MSAPSLPEIFGNYVLGDFVEVVSPTAISWWPQTTGWLWLAIALALLLGRYSYRRLRQWYRNRYRREANGRLQVLAQSPDNDTLLLELNKVLKLTAIAAFSRERVAGLTGQDWVDFLNSSCAQASFSEDQGRLLAVGIYSRETPSAEAATPLIAASMAWVRDHESPQHV